MDIITLVLLFLRPEGGGGEGRRKRWPAVPGWIAALMKDLALSVVSREPRRLHLHLLHLFLG